MSPLHPAGVGRPKLTEGPARVAIALAATCLVVALVAVPVPAFAGVPAGPIHTATATATARTTTSTRTTASTATSDRVLSGKELLSGTEIRTSTASHRLVMQTDGNAVLYAGAITLWSTGTPGNPGARLRMGTDGALTVRSTTGSVLWSNSIGSPRARLVIKPDGRLYEIAASGKAEWWTLPPRPAATSYLTAAPPYVLPNSTSAIGAKKARAEGRLDDADLLDKAANQGSARWLLPEDGISAVEGRVRSLAEAARAAGKTPVFVTYAIPNRDCGSMSAGGFSVSDYRLWSAAVARGLQGFRSVVIVEPDSLLHVYSCGDSAERFALLKQASSSYAAAGAEVYLDASTNTTFGRNAATLADISARLRAAGVDQVAGFSTNVSNFHATAAERTYGNALSNLLGGASYVIDTSRNGNGALRDANGMGVWCNPPGRALGDRPGATNDGAHVANLWIKTVGRSDGTCNGGPPAGKYWEEYLLGLAANAHW